MRADAQQQKAWRDRLGPLMEARREDLGLLWSDVADVVGVTTEALRNIRLKSGGMRNLTKRGIERALQWEAGSVDAILRGGEPTPTPPQPTPTSEPPQGDSTTGYPGFIPAPWVTTALNGEGSSPEDFRPLVEFLRAVGEKSGYSLGETLVEAGLATSVELAVRRGPAPPRQTPDELYQDQVRRITDDPNMSRGEKKDMLRSIKRLREALSPTQSEDP